MRTIVKIGHFAGGLVSALIPFNFSFLAFIIFLTYEIIEYVKLKDTLYLEMRQYAIGFFLGLGIRLVFAYIHLI